MSKKHEHIQGTVDEIGGSLQKNIGKVIGDEVMEAEGSAKQQAGRKRRKSARIRERVKGGLDEIGGAMKNLAGVLKDDEELKTEGKAAEIRGTTRRNSDKELP
jgi:uncharacterized protein YjbJ (UPF0337 family)